MKNIYILSSLLLLTTLFNSIAQQSNDFDVTDKKFPYLYELVEGYVADNFEYPVTVDEILAYWQADKCSARTREILTDQTIRILDTLTFSRLEQEREHIKFRFSENRDYYIVCFKQDTLFALPTINFCNPSAGYAPIDGANMRNFFRVSMQRSDSHEFNIATEEMQYLFNKGLYDMVATKLPEFRKNRKQKKVFNSTVLIFENGNLTSQGRTGNFAPTVLPLYDDVREYAASFASEHKLSRIIFYYMYD